MLQSLLFFILFAISPVVWAEASDTSFLSPLEKSILDEHNRVRANPKKYAKELKAKLAYFDGKVLKVPGERKIYSVEGPKALKEAYKKVKRKRRLPPLKASRGMSRAARDHVLDTGPPGIMSHAGTDGQRVQHRVNRYGKWRKKVGENITFGRNTGPGVVYMLIVDDGIKDRGHRKNFFDPAYTTVGIACGPHKKYRTMCVMDYAAGYSETMTLRK